MVVPLLSALILLIYCNAKGLALTCYECENCVETEAFLRSHIKQCPDSSYISCLMTESKFAHHKLTSRSCSRAPAVNPDCSNHLVNILRATVCICDQPLCNGLNAFVNYTNTINRVFNNQNKLLLTNNHIRLTDSNGNKEDFMPLHDFDEQRIAAMLGTHNSANTNNMNKNTIMSVLWSPTSSSSPLMKFMLILCLFLLPL